MALAYMGNNSEPAYQTEAISSMEIIRYDSRRLPYLTEENRHYCGLFKITCGTAHGFAEFDLPQESAPEDLITWISVFTVLKELTVEQAKTCIADHEQDWGMERTRIAEEALADLQLMQEADEELHSIISSRSLVRSFLMEYGLTYYSF
ncbi:MULTISPECIES: hypothetical protein [unclassified Paenibacillus]|uniref:Uncharacterized protein n=1 Tax=Paenibacillus provencensis TaxID=441151 RepID=A0ABW3Q040_9BACL|nr:MULTISPECIES: hypothetical protein [unclassified Paenibacillus]MCM3129306.1 hypothetical protein [Paenibacillus sp. MER 78]SFS71253.1 hypothetical protein SAMN04488601_102158 [Paenibacillus sp. 453mf]